MKSLQDKVAALRGKLAELDISGFIIPHDDEYQNEYLPPAAERLTFISGFTGSSGTAVVLEKTAALFVDGRYTLQAPLETDTSVYTLKNTPKDSVSEWIKAELPENGKLGYDPWLHSEDWVRNAKKKGLDLVAVSANPLDAIWNDRPALLSSPAVPHPLCFAGESHEDKRKRLAEALRKDGDEAFVVTRQDSLAWLLNIRGADVPHTPFALGFAILHADATVDLFILPEKIGPETKAHLGPDIRLHPPSAFVPRISQLAGQVKLAADPAAAASAIFAAADRKISPLTDPCTLPKACKNATELEGTQNAHRRDGVALVRFLFWLSQQTGVDELAVMAKLRGFRAEGNHFRDLSFETIAGSGPNGAIVHYRASEKTNRTLQQGEFLLLDSGAQYLDGTTDVTRTIAIGPVSPEMKNRFTRVLKGHIGVASAVFPVGTTGSALDSMARRPLWEAGLDYNHRTGHGVGSYLSVHEGPGYIGAKEQVPLQPGMVISNEPGYYKTGAYGIRIESLVAVEQVKIEGAEREMLGLRTLTLCPIDRNAIDVDLLTAAERDWLNAYHQRVWTELAPALNTEEQLWLKAATAAL